MIQINMKKSERGDIIGFHVSGHAGFSRYGTDIVCAGVSVLVINCINSIEKFSNTAFELNEEESEGMVDFTCIEPVDAQAELLLKSLLYGIQGIQKTYGNEYVTLH